MLTLVLTRWVVAGVGIGLLVACWQRLLGGNAEENRGIARLEALANWTESLRDTIAGAIGLEQAIPATAGTSAPALRPSLNLLVDRLRIREPLPDALLRFAGDVDDASADVVVAALVLNARLRGPGLRDVLTALAASTREELDVRRRIEASRRSIRRLSLSFSSGMMPRASYAAFSSSKASCSACTASSMYFRSISTEILISEVEMTLMLTPCSDSALNIVAATPAWLRMPMPTTDTLATSSSMISSS